MWRRGAKRTRGVGWGRERLELVDALVDDVPDPLIGQLELDRLVGGEEQVEDVAVVGPRLDPLLERRLQLRVDVTVVQLLVQQQELLVIVDERVEVVQDLMDRPDLHIGAPSIAIIR